MHHLWCLLSLPSSLILLVTTSPWNVDAGLQLPRSAVAEEKNHVEEEHLIKRGLAAMEKLASRPPTRVRKMSGDPGEMFFLDYWGFDDDIVTVPGSDPPAGNAHDPGSVLRARSVLGDYDNATFSEFLLPALRPNTEQLGQESLYGDILRFFRRSNLAPRDFSCPTNSTPCASINRTDICCGSGETCFLGTDTGCGEVGCCPRGQTCSGPVQCCNTAAGYASCPETTNVGNNGGCCIPGFTCYSTGCISTSTSTTVITAPTVTVTTGVPPSSSFSSGGSAGARQTGQASSSSTTMSSSTATASSSTTSGPGTTTITSLNSLCPTNMYFCSAYYRPGCCIVNRDCGLTNCLFATSTSTFVSDGVTVGVPVGGSTGGTEIIFTNVQTTGVSASFKTNGACVDGFQPCAPSLDGGCCPAGFACESGPSCTAMAGMGATGEVAKVSPSLATEGRIVGVWGWVCVGVGVVMGALMVVL